MLSFYEPDISLWECFNRTGKVFELVVKHNIVEFNRIIIKDKTNLGVNPFRWSPWQACYRLNDTVRSATWKYLNCIARNCLLKSSSSLIS